MSEAFERQPQVVLDDVGRLGRCGLVRELIGELLEIMPRKHIANHVLDLHDTEPSQLSIHLQSPVTPARECPLAALCVESNIVRADQVRVDDRESAHGVGVIRMIGGPPLRAQMLDAPTLEVRWSVVGGFIAGTSLHQACRLHSEALLQRLLRECQRSRRQVEEQLRQMHRVDAQGRCNGLR
ncbi:hypothetical protein [Halochromatium glycolicum]|uniref:hypothetical protein n=1 Tax=Halochromatium glycolicum TaxID=85075 RepID=UPI00190C9E03|nr:hypothetical protein [Halochromatium glycolicum]